MKTEEENIKNIAFIDGQNLHLGTTMSKQPWKIDLFRFREYLRRKYQVDRALYFIGCYDDLQKKLYKDIEDAGFEIIFREHGLKSKSLKKGNVDTDVVYYMLSGFITGEYSESKVILVSGDGDYYRAVKFLISNGYFKKILLPSKKNYSRLYKLISQKYRVFLDEPDVQKKIAYKK